RESFVHEAARAPPCGFLGEVAARQLAPRVGGDWPEQRTEQRGQHDGYGYDKPEQAAVSPAPAQDDFRNRLPLFETFAPVEGVVVNEAAAVQVIDLPCGVRTSLLAIVMDEKDFGLHSRAVAWDIALGL